jgi:hypothetical protein
MIPILKKKLNSEGDRFIENGFIALKKPSASLGE